LASGSRNRDEEAGTTYRDGDGGRRGGGGQGRFEDLVPERLFLLRSPRTMELRRRRREGRRVRGGRNRSLDGEAWGRGRGVDAIFIYQPPLLPFPREALLFLGVALRRVAARYWSPLRYCPGRRAPPVRPRLVASWDRLGRLRFCRRWLALRGCATYVARNLRPGVDAFPGVDVAVAQPHRQARHDSALRRLCGVEERYF
jgi:hypothetical protein